MSKPAKHKPLKTETGCRPAQLFGPWAIEPTRFQAMYAQAVKVDLASLAKPKSDGMPSAPLPTQKPDVKKVPYGMDGSTALISISGPMTKYETSFQSMFGGTSTLEVRRQLRMADDDEDVGGIMLLIDSPGGTVDGTADLGTDIAAVHKPIHAYVSDMCCSAALWCASQADSITCNQTATVGSIGTLMVIEDTSNAYAQAGVKVHVVSTGEMKGAGTDGVKVTDSQLSYFQGIADDLNEHFIEAISSGRAMTIKEARALADGRVHIGAKAKTLGLVDSVASYDDAMKALSKDISMKSDTLEAYKASHPEAYEATYQAGFEAAKLQFTPKAATVAELKSAFPNHSGFIVDQIGLNATLSDAKAAFADVISTDFKAEQAKTTALTTELEKAKAEASDFGGVPNLISSNTVTATDGDVKTRWNALVKANTDKGMSHFNALKAAHAADPELHKEFVIASQPAPVAK